MTDKLNNNRTLKIVLIITAILGFVVFFYTQIDKSINNSPVVIELKLNQKNIQGQLGKLENQMDGLEKQLNKMDVKLDIIVDKK